MRVIIWATTLACCGGLGIGCGWDDCDEDPLYGFEVAASQCQDGSDNDGDGLFDCADPDCQGFVFCAGAGGDADGDADGDGDGDGDADLSCDDPPGSDAYPFDYAKLLIEHNAADEDTGFQGALDGTAWNDVIVCGPDGAILEISAQGTMREVGLTELFYETQEPPNDLVPIPDWLAHLPEGEYDFYGQSVDGEPLAGTASFTHDIPKGPVITAPAPDEVVSADEDLLISWEHVTETIDEESVDVTHYQLIVELDVEPDHHGFGTSELSVHAPASVTSMRVPHEFLAPGQPYAFEILAIEASGNQTIAAQSFSTE
jgi:hypothetical protein